MQRGYIVLCTSANKTIFIIIIIIVIIIVMKSGAPLLGLAKSIYYGVYKLATELTYNGEGIVRD